MKKRASLKQKNVLRTRYTLSRQLLWDKKETLNEVPSISSCFDELEAALRTNDFSASSAIHDRTLALENATMHHFECTHYNHHRSFTGECIFANLDSQLPLF
jgi:hypothetical protein